MSRPLVAPHFLNPGDTIGIFTPSSPAYIENPGLFENGLRNIEKLGFKIKLGNLTATRANEGYRPANGERRAKEFMDLIMDPEVKGLISTIGGYNSNSLIPYLDYETIRASRKIICGYSDVTSLHLAILKYARLRTFYGPAVMCWFGDWPSGIKESSDWFLDATMRHKSGPREVLAPKQWSNHLRDWKNGDWKNIPREWEKNPGWESLSLGKVEAPIIAVNLNTLMSAAGTNYWPDLKGKVLLLEEMAAPLSKEERALRQLQLMGVYDEIAGLIVSKPEVYSNEGAPFELRDLLLEIVGKRNYPIIISFDCGHTSPMVTVPQEVKVSLEAITPNSVRFSFLEPACN